MSIYGGYFGAGLGVIFLAVFAVIGLSDFHTANALKNLTNSLIGFLGVVIYAVSDLISWPHALLMMIGSAMGGYAGIRLTRLLPRNWLSNSIVVLGVLLTGYYFYTG